MAEKYSKLALLQPDEEIRLKFKRDEILKTIFEEVNKYVARKYFNSPTDVRLIRFIAILIENLVKKKYKIDKQILFSELLKLLFPSISDNEILQDNQLVKDLLNNNQIKKIPVLKYARHLAYEFCKDFTYNFFLPKI